MRRALNPRRCASLEILLDDWLRVAWRDAVQIENVRNRNADRSFRRFHLLLVLHRQHRAGLRGEAVVGRGDRLVAIRNIRGHVHIELKLAGVDVQPGESDVGLDSADGYDGEGRQTPGLRHRSADDRRRGYPKSVGEQQDGFSGLGRRRRAGVRRRRADVGAVQMHTNDVGSIEDEEGGRESLRLR